MSSAPRVVLVTGPVQGLEDYAAAARSVGWTALEWPLITIEARDVDLAALIRARIDGLPDGIAVTSSHALAALERALARMPELATVPFCCVGARTQERARRLGLQPALPASPDAEHLAAALIARMGPESVLLWPRGSRSRQLGEALAAAGHRVLDPIVYETRAESQAPPVEAARADAALLASPSAVEALAARRTRPGRPGCVALAIGRTTAAALQQHPGLFEAILTLAHPAPAALATLLAEFEPPTRQP